MMGFAKKATKLLGEVTKLREGVARDEANVTVMSG